jgi:hypothetical protein
MRRKSVENVRPYEAIFNANVDRSGGPDACWPWTGSRRKKGHPYGIISIGGKHRVAHRVAWALSRDGMLPISRAGAHAICHRCDNPPCCNPAHLFDGMQSDNAKDMWTKRRGKAPTPMLGVEHAGAILNDDLVGQMRSERASGATFRALQRKYKVHWATIRDAVTGITWEHLDAPVCDRARRSPTMLTEEIVTLARSGLATDAELAQRFGVEVHAVASARIGKTWLYHPLPPLRRTFPEAAHGNRKMYRNGCRCEPCVRAERERLRASKARCAARDATQARATSR